MSQGKTPLIDITDCSAEHRDSSQRTNSCVIIDAGAPADLLAYLRESFGYWQLLMFLVWRDVLIKYRRTFLGLGWAIVQPVLQASVIWWFVGGRSGNNMDNLDSLTCIVLGTSLWLYGANTIMGAVHQLSSNSQLITKVYFPRVLLVVAPAMTHLFDLAVMTLLLLAIIILRQGANTMLFLLPISYAGTILFTLGPAAIAGGLAAKYRDVKHITPYLMQVWFFSTPSIYVPCMSHDRSVDIVLTGVNPLHGWVAMAQDCMNGACGNWGLWCVGTISSVFWCVFGLWVFARLERDLADHV